MVDAFDVPANCQEDNEFEKVNEIDNENDKENENEESNNLD